MVITKNKETILVSNEILIGHYRIELKHLMLQKKILVEERSLKPFCNNVFDK